MFEIPIEISKNKNNEKIAEKIGIDFPNHQQFQNKTNNKDTKETSRFFQTPDNNGLTNNNSSKPAY